MIIVIIELSYTQNKNNKIKQSFKQTININSHIKPYR